MLLRYSILLVVLLYSFFTTTAQTRPNIVWVEYFIDNDPGYGKATSVAVTPGQNLNNLSVNLQPGNYTEGVHFFCVRARDANGVWSLDNKWMFVVPFGGGTATPAPNIRYVEYFVDNDPGYGKATSVAVTQGQNLNNLTVNLQPANYTEGVHFFCVRARDANGVWSLDNKWMFVVPFGGGTATPAPNIRYVEYFIDNDPGYGKANAVPVTAGQNLNNLSVSLKPSDYSEGVHFFCVRARDANGVWSLDNKWLFVVPFGGSTAAEIPDLQAIEYYIDTDPGYGRATAIPFERGKKLEDITATINARNLSPGEHTLVLRAKDAKGAWSLNIAHNFTIAGAGENVITVGELPEKICAGVALRLPFETNGSFDAGNIFTAQLSDISGNFNNPVNIGTLTGTTEGNIETIIPAGTSSGSQYRIRIVSTSPIDTSDVSSYPLSIFHKPEQSIQLTGITEVCLGTQSYSIGSSETGVSYTWRLSGGGILQSNETAGTINWTNAGLHTIGVSDSNFCGKGAEATLQVRVFATAPTVTPVITAGNGYLETQPANATQGTAGYQWFKDGVAVSSATDVRYYSIEEGVYTVSYTNPCGIGQASSPHVISNRIAQTISFNAIPDKSSSDAPFTLQATASSGLPVVFNVVSGPATISGNTVTLTGAGTVIIEAIQPGDASYHAATPVQQSFEVRYVSPDLAVENITTNANSLAPGDGIRISWRVANKGTAPAPINWTERIYMQSPNGQNRTLLKQTDFSTGGNITANGTLQRSDSVTLPLQFDIGNQGVFVVELIPGTGIIEAPGDEANNTGIQQTAWSIKKLLSLSLSGGQLTEGSTTGITATINRTGSLADALTVTILSNKTGVLNTPTSVLIPAGQSGVTFTVSAIDNNKAEGTVNDSLKLTAAGYTGAAVIIYVLDNDNGTLSITNLPAEVTEGERISFRINTDMPLDAPLEVFLSSDNTSRFAVPASITIPKGNSSVQVTVTPPQNDIPEPDVDVTLSLGAQHHNPATASIRLKDNDLPAIALTIETDIISESAGLYATKARLQRVAGASTAAFTANLSASISNTLILPQSISFVEGEKEKQFDIGVVDNTLAEGEREVTITAAIFINSCGCNAPPASAGFVSAPLTVTDNDGPALQLTASALSLPEGMSNAGKLRVMRNTTTNSAIIVNLSSSNTNEATVPATVTIPTGEQFIDVPITTINDGITDGSQQVYFKATANGFAPGTVWVVVTDLNKPDFEISEVTLSKDTLQSGFLFNYRLVLKNSGRATAPSGVSVRGYLSKDDILDDSDSLYTDDVYNSSIPTGETREVVNAVKAPAMPGDYKLLFKINPDLGLSEILTSNNISKATSLVVLPDYIATAQVNAAYFTQNTAVPISGNAILYTGLPAGNKQVEVYIITNGLRRTVTATTNASGQYTAQFVPLSNEAGSYTVGASYPGLNETAEQDKFDILGVKINEGIPLQLKTNLNDTIKGFIAVQNLSSQPLSNFTLLPLSLPAGAAIRFDTLATLGANATSSIGYTVTGSALSPGMYYEVVTMQAIAQQAIVQTAQMLYFCQAPQAYLVTDITKIDATVSQSAGERLVEFILINKGSGNTGEVKINLPKVGWLSAVTPELTRSMATGDSARIVLKFTATEEIPFNYPITGSIGITSQNGNSFSIPFSFEKVAESNGNVKVTVTNQFTYLTEAKPNVANALVQIKNYFTGQLYAEGYTDSVGIFIGNNIPEGKHRIVVEKEKHQPYNSTVTIDPGKTVDAVVFINYQAITFSWTVVPTAIQDQYDITLTAEFETHVPMPVVTIDMPKTMPQLSGSEVYAFNVVLTNHGLITAKEVDLMLPDDDPEYEFVSNYVKADLLAQQSIQVPVIMRRRTGPPSGRAGSFSPEGISKFLGITSPRMNTSSSQQDPCKGYIKIRYWYWCNFATGIWQTYAKEFQLPFRTCLGTKEILIGGGGFPYNGNGIYFDIPCFFCDTGGGSLGPGLILPEIPPFEIERKSCQECLLEIGKTVFKCVIVSRLGGKKVGKVLSAIMPRKKKVDTDCIKGVIKTIWTCARTEAVEVSSREAASKISQSSSSQIGEVYKQIATNFQTSVDAFDNSENWAIEYFGELINSDAWEDLEALLEPYISKMDSIPGTAQSNILTSMTGYEIDQSLIQSFFIRWNTSIRAKELGVEEPNSQYPDIISWTLVQAWADSIAEANNKAIDQGFESINDMLESEHENLKTILDQQSQAVCASVTVQFKQQLTMTREAFEGTLEIFNGHPTDKMDSLSVVIQITDANGAPANGLFEIQTRSLSNLPNVTGTGFINAQNKGSVKFLFIPELGAAPVAPKVYNFGGYVRYWDPYAGAMVNMPLSSVPITVNPSPNLMLHYFMERNILGDDALTSPAIEPSVPAELAVMVENHGYGPAVNMMISSAQPKIIENEKGLAINFELIGSNFQGQPKSLGVTDINFGTIPALQTRIGQWYFTSSLLGKFVSYKAEVVHANSFGNPDLSLVQGIILHELTKSIKEYGALADNINDFLVNDIFDVHDRPDIIYFSQGKRTAKVYPALEGNFSSPVNGPDFSNTLTITASDTGWNFIKLNDPGYGIYELESVTRSDGQLIPINNAWLTFVTLPVSRPPVYENKFHFVDSFPSSTPVAYTVKWKPKNMDVPQVLSINGITEPVTSQQIQKLTAVFSKPIDASTFTYEDLILTFQGGPDIADDKIIITRIDSVTFDIDLSALTTGNGFYSFTVQAANVSDIFGINGTTGQRVTWSQFLTIPTVQAFLGLPENKLAAAYDTVSVLFNLPVDATTVTPARFTIRKDGEQIPGSLVIDSVRADQKLFYLSGLGSILTSDGEYELVVDVPNIKSVEGENGAMEQSVKLTVDNTGPLVLSMEKSYTESLDSQHVSFVNIRFNENVKGFNTSAIRLTWNGELVPLQITQLSNTDLKNWSAGSFGMQTYPDGEYVLTLMLNGITDAIGNTGTGTKQISWTVNRSSQINISNLKITPDKGFSDSDGVTSELPITVSFQLDTEASQVTISQIDVGGEVVVLTKANIAAGQVTIPVTLVAGGNTGIRVTATGKNGGTSTIEKTLYIDVSPLVAQWNNPPALEIPNQVDTATIQFSAKLLNNVDLIKALQFKRNGEMLSTSNLLFKAVNDTVYIVYGLRNTSALPGNYQLLLDLRQFNKYSSGIAGAGFIASSWSVITVNNTPVANAGENITVSAPATVTLNGTGSSDPDGNTITYQWVPPAGIVLSDPTIASPSFTVTTGDIGKTYSILLIVNDGGLTATDMVEVKVMPPGTEVCDGIDNDGDGDVDEGFEKTTWYLDADKDGFGDNANSITNCQKPAGDYVTNNTDCAPNDAAIWRSATLYIDKDGDGYTNGTETVCYGQDIPAGYSQTTNGTDCNDSEALVHPGAVEICGNGIDENCDGSDIACTPEDRDGDGVSDNLDCAPDDKTKWQSAILYIDSDNDGYDNGQTTLCYGSTIPSGYKTATLGQDCNDNVATVHPGAEEICDNGIDENCDGSDGVCIPTDNDGDGIADDEDCAPDDKTKWQSAMVYIDADNDGYDNGQTTVCYGSSLPTGYSTQTQGSDCNDNNASIHPGATELCDGSDNNCNNVTDEGCGAAGVYYSKSTGNLHNLTSWGTNADGSGAAPADFGDANTFTLANRNGIYTLTANWSVAGTVHNPAGSQLQINGYTLTLTTLTGAGTLTGSATSNLAITGTGDFGTLNFSTGGALGSFTLNRNGSVTIGAALSICDVLTITSGTLNTANKLTLKSTATNTARVAPVTGAVAGNVTVERYIPARRAWRILTAPVAGNQSINQAWQEGVTLASPNPNPYPGYGTIITKGTTADGFDQNIPGQTYSILSYNSSADKWIDVTSTRSNAVNQTPYFLFVRGDRTVTTSGTKPTTLRANGPLKTGDQVFNVAANGYTAVGNPFAAPINFATITRNNVDNSFYVWDPKMGGTKGTGAYVNISFNGTGYDIVPKAVSPESQYIQSGQGFLVHSSGNAGSIVIKESDKSATPARNVFKVGEQKEEDETILFVPAKNAYGIRVNLQVEDSSGYTVLDEVLASYSKNFADKIDGMDVPKLYNIMENLSFNRKGNTLMVERRLPIGNADTLYLQLGNTQQKNYVFEFDPIALKDVVSATLVDHYMHSNTTISTAEITRIHFMVTADAASSGNNRFELRLTRKTVQPSGNKPVISAYPNPVLNGNISLGFEYVPRGEYHIELSNSVGQIITQKVIYHNGENIKHRLNLGIAMTAGIYQLRITGQNIQTTIKLLKK